MMGYIFSGMVILSVTAGIFFGRLPDVSQALIAGGGEAVDTVLSILGTLALWSGLMEVAKRSGLTLLIAKALSPVTRFFFPKLESEDREAVEAISLSMTANMLGLGSAATPLGLKAMGRLDVHNSRRVRASRHMVVLAVLNTSSFEVFPTTVVAVRQSAGSSQPADILLCVWLVSLATLAVAMSIAKLVGRDDG